MPVLLAQRVSYLPLTGALTEADAITSFEDQIRGLKAGGADIIWIETMSAPEEIRAASQAAINQNMPYCYTGSFDTAGKTMMGLHPKDIGHVNETLAEQPIGFGANCGVGASDILSSLLDMGQKPQNGHLIVKGNCGIPEFKGDEIHYSGTPELMADYVRLAIDGGATIIGGCCGTSCDHLVAMRAAMDTHIKAQPPTLDLIVSHIGPLRNKPANDAAPKPKRRSRRRAS